MEMSKKDYRVGGFYTYNQKLAEEHYNFNYVIVNHTRRAEFNPLYYYIRVPFLLSYYPLI